MLATTGRSALESLSSTYVAEHLRSSDMPKLDFSYLVSPHSADDFLADYWQKHSLLIRGNEKARFQTLLLATDIDAVLLMADKLPSEAVELVGRTGEIEYQESKSHGVLKDFFIQGSTIRVREINKHFRPVNEMCRKIEEELGFPTRANLYCTPAGARGFDLHFDTHDVLVLQLLGKKKWQIYESTFRLPLEYVPPLIFEDDRAALKRARGARQAGQDEMSAAELGPLALETSLETGDCLYLPRGFVHQAESLDEASVHLSIGIHVLTWLDLLAVGLGQTANRQESFRQALPIGWHKDSDIRKTLASEFSRRVQLFSQSADPRRALDEIADSMTHHRQVASTEAGANGLALETKLEGKGRLQIYLSNDGRLAGLALGEKAFWMPASLAPALRFIAERKSFCVHELPGQFTDDSKLNFVRRLVEDEFLRIAD
jgi:ribosomal protein L16 Arg81 hydroxylase